MKGTNRHPLVAATLLVVVGAVSGCPSSPASPSSAPASAVAGSAVEINNFAFTPVALTVSQGTTVTWKFDDSTDHTVTADDNSFTSQALGGGKTYEHTFSTAGTLTYHCSIHPFMKGSVEVR